MDFEAYERQIIADVRAELHSSFIIQKIDGAFVVTIDSVGDQPSYDDLKNAMGILFILSGRINGILYEDVKVRYEELRKSRIAEDPIEGARARRQFYTRRFRG